MASPWPHIAVIATLVVLLVVRHFALSPRQASRPNNLDGIKLPVAPRPTESEQPQDGDELVRADHHLVDTELALDASREWQPSSRNRSAGSRYSPENEDHSECSSLLRQHGLCDPALLELAASPVASAPPERPFVFLHFSKCAGTSLLSSLDYLGRSPFSLHLPPGLRTTSRCGHTQSQKCCWWRERLQNMSAEGESLKVLSQEPANDEQWLDDDGGHGEWRVVRSVDPGFDATTDFCAGTLSYVTVLRRPIPRVHSHMCEVGVGFRDWQDTRTAAVGHVKRQLRDNYYVRSLGGPDAWGAPEGGLRQRHLIAAARTVARFDVVMTVETLQRDAPAQMGRVGLPDFRPRHVFFRSRDDNLERVAREPWLRTSAAEKTAACEVPPTPHELERLVAGCALDAVLYEFVSMVAARRTAAAGRAASTATGHASGATSAASTSASAMGSYRSTETGSSRSNTTTSSRSTLTTRSSSKQQQQQQQHESRVASRIRRKAMRRQRA